MLIAHREPDVIAITEVIPKARLYPITAAMLQLTGYELFTNFELNKPNPGSSGSRGIAVYVKANIQANELPLAENSIEHLWLTVNLKHHDKLTLGCIYRSPSSNPATSTEEVCDLLRKVTDLSPSHLVVTGDFNYNDINWINWCISGSPNSPSTYFIDTLQDCYLYQHVTEPTRYRHDHSPHILDLILSNEEGMISELQYLPGLWKSDHVCLMFNLTLYATAAPASTPRPNYNRGNYQTICRGLNQVAWDSLLANKPLSEAWDVLERELTILTKENIPLTKSATKRKNIYMTQGAMKLKKTKNECWSRYVGTSSEVDRLRFNIVRNKLRSLTRKLRREHESQIAQKAKSNPKAFWKYVNSRLKTKSKINNLDRQDGTTATTDLDKAELLNDFFCSVFTIEDLSYLPPMNNTFNGQPLDTMNITEASVLQKLNRLLPNKSPGPDGWHPRLLKETSTALAKPLHMLLQKSLDSGELPPSWKEGHITPIHKKGSKRSAANFRPISLTSIFSKIMETQIRDCIVDHMMANDMFADEQHGFVPGRSCITQLLVVLEKWTATIEEGTSIDAIYLDFKKAFDSVPHERLLIKLAAYGVQGNLLNWIRQFLSGRKQRVVINGQKSTWANVTSGIPQGSVLGPVLFVIFINDLPSVIQSIARIFADDTKMFRSLKTPADALTLQEDISNLQKWSKTWQLSFNETKCKVLHLGPSNPNHNYIMNGITLESLEKEKDLGIIIDSKLKFHTHTAAVISKANQILAVIKKTFLSLDSTTLPMLYKSLVRPHLEYGNCIWGPHYVMDTKAVERVQRRATKLVKVIKELPYTERLKYLQIPSLYYRRKRGDMIQVYKILNNIDRVNPEQFFQILDNRTTRGHHLKIFKPFAARDCRRKFFSQRVIDDWNCLPTEVVSAETINSFKNRLDIYFQKELYSTPH